MARISNWIGSAALAAVALTGGALSIATQANAADPYTCMTDDGYGRLRPCSAGYMAANPNWRAGDSCFTDDGYGRYRPCSAGYKPAAGPNAQPAAPAQQEQKK